MIADEMQSGQAEFSAQCLLTGCAPRAITPEDVAHWQRAQLLLPVAAALAATGDKPLPALMVEPVASARRVAAAAEAGERHATMAVLEALNQASIPAILLKGTALAYTVYPQPWLRARSDIDVLIPAGRLDRASVALRSLQLAPAREVTHPLISRQRHFHSTARYPVAVDVHDALVNPPVLRTLPTFDELWARSQAVRALAPHARALGTPDALLHALVHRVAHHNSSIDLLWLNDLRLLVAQMGSSDWEMFARTAERAGVAAIAVDGLRALSAVLHIQAPEDVTSQLASVRGERSAALLGGALTELRLQWINFRSLNGARERLAFMRAHLAPPRSELTDKDYMAASDSLRAPAGASVRVYASRLLGGVPKWLRPISKAR